MKWIVVLLLLMRCAQPLSAQQHSPQAEAALRSVGLNGLEQRLLIDIDGQRGFFAYGSSVGQLDYVSGGVRTDELTAGSVHLSGLVRELNRPTRFSSSSEVYGETPGLLLNSAMEAPRRYGLQLQPWQAAPALFAAVRDGAPEILGMHWSLGSRPLMLRALLSTADPGADTVDSGWYTEYPRFSGGRVQHGALEAVLSVDGARLAAAFVGSGGPRAAPSSAVRVHADYRSSGFRGRGLWVLTQPGYITPEGRFWRDAQQRAADLRLGRTRGLFLELRADRRLTRAPLQDNRTAPERTSYAAAAGTSRAAVGALRLTAAAASAQSVFRDDRGRRGASRSIGADVAVEGGGVTVRLVGEREWEDGSWQHDRLQLGAGLAIGALALGARALATLRGAESAYAGRLEVRIRARRLRLYARVATLEEITIEEAVQLRKIPLVVTLGGAVSFTLPPVGRPLMIRDPLTTLPPEALRVPE